MINMPVPLLIELLQKAMIQMKSTERTDNEERRYDRDRRRSDRHGSGPQDRQLAMTPMEHPEIEIVQIRFNYVDYEDASRCFRNLLFYL